MAVVFLQPGGNWDQGSSAPWEMCQERSLAAVRMETGRAGAHVEGVSVCVCLCVQTQGLSLLWPPCLLLTLTTGCTQLEDRGQVWPGDAACTGQPPGHRAGQRRVERHRGRTQRLCSPGAYSCLPSLSVYRDRTLLTHSKNHGM